MTKRASPSDKTSQCQRPRHKAEADVTTAEASGQEEPSGPRSAAPSGALSSADVEPQFQAEYADCVNRIHDIHNMSACIKFDRAQQFFKLAEAAHATSNAAAVQAGSEAQRLADELKSAVHDDQVAAKKSALMEANSLAVEQEVAHAVAAAAAAEEAAKKVVAEAKKVDTAKHAAAAEKEATAVKVKDIQELKRKADDQSKQSKLEQDNNFNAYKQEAWYWNEAYKNVSKIASEWMVAHEKRVFKEVDLPEGVIQAALEWERRQAQAQGPVQGPAAEAGKAPASPMPPGTAPGPSVEAMASAASAGRAQGAATMAPTPSMAAAASVLVD